MSFASVLDSYCSSLNCTNARIAKQCGISAPSLSRYRNGSRLPANNSRIISDLARGIATLSKRDEADQVFKQSEIAISLEAARKGLHIVGMSFSERLDKLMTTFGIRNTELASIAKIDPSYLSRIRSGQRMPIDRESLAQPCAGIVAHWCVYNNDFGPLLLLIEDYAEPIGKLKDYSDIEAALADDIMEWLIGNEIAEADIAETKRLFDWMESFDFGQSTEDLLRFVEMEPADLTPRAGFFYGLEAMRNTELEFMNIAASARASLVSLSSAAPTMYDDADDKYFKKHMAAISRIVQRGGRVNVIHSFERPLHEALVSLQYWMPLYMTGRVTPYSLRGMRSRLFTHVNYVCEYCAMSSEAVVGHPSEARYYMSLLPEDIAYYTRKFELILEKAEPLLEIYLADIPGDLERFEEGEKERRANAKSREVCAGMYENIQVMMYPTDCVVVSLLKEPVAHLVIRIPKIRYAISLMN